MQSKSIFLLSYLKGLILRVNFEENLRLKRFLKEFELAQISLQILAVLLSNEYDHGQVNSVIAWNLTMVLVALFFISKIFEAQNFSIFENLIESLSNFMGDSRL